MEQQLLALMETGGSAEAALREEKRMRSEAEAKLAAMESQYESAVFALNERESGAVTERMLQKQKQLRSHVREVEQALRARQEDEVRRLRLAKEFHAATLAIKLPGILLCRFACGQYCSVGVASCLLAPCFALCHTSACSRGGNVRDPAAERDSAPGASTVR